MSIYTSLTAKSTADRRQAYLAWVELGAELGFVVGINPNQSSTLIAAELLARCGPRKSAWARTKLNGLLEARDGRRQAHVGGRPVVRRTKPAVAVVDHHYDIAAE